MRTCSRCNRPLEDPEFHEIEEPLVAPARILGWYQGNPVRAADPERGRRFYGCKMTLIAIGPESGKTLFPNSRQRTDVTDTCFVHDARLEGDLA